MKPRSNAFAGLPRGGLYAAGEAPEELDIDKLADATLEALAADKAVPPGLRADAKAALAERAAGTGKPVGGVKLARRAAGATSKYEPIIASHVGSNSFVESCERAAKAAGR